MKRFTIGTAMAGAVLAALGVTMAAEAQPHGHGRARGGGGTTAIDTRVCTANENNDVTSAKGEALHYLNATIEHLEPLVMVPYPPVPKAVEAKLHKHFRTMPGNVMAERAVMGKLLEGYRAIRANLLDPGRVQWTCASQCQSANEIASAPTTTVVFCNLFFAKPPQTRASTWIHEQSHTLLRTTDNVYYAPSGSCGASSATCLGAADPWGNFAVDR